MKRKRFIAMLSAAAVTFAACSQATVENDGKNIQDAVNNIADMDNKYVKMVKGGYKETDPDVTYEMVFSAFFGTPR